MYAEKFSVMDQQTNVPFIFFLYIGVDVYHQARHRQTQQTDRHASELYQDPETIQQASDGTYLERGGCSTKQAG